KVCTVEPGSLKVGILQASFPQVGVEESRLAQVGFGEMGPCQVAVREVCCFQKGVIKPQVTQIKPFQIRSTQVRLDVGMPLSPVVPFVVILGRGKRLLKQTKVHLVAVESPLVRRQACAPFCQSLPLCVELPGQTANDSPGYGSRSALG